MLHTHFTCEPSKEVEFLSHSGLNATGTVCCRQIIAGLNCIAAIGVDFILAQIHNLARDPFTCAHVVIKIYTLLLEKVANN
jgi:hypothetical protein